MAPKKAKCHVSAEVKGRIVGLRQAGFSYPAVKDLLKAEKINIPLKTIQRIGHTFLTTGSLARKPGSGRPRVTSFRDDRHLKMTVLQQRKKTLTKVAEDFRTSDNKVVSRRTITRRLKEAGFSSKRCAKKPLLSKKNVTDRLTFLQLYGHHDSQWFQHVLWSDESRFELCTDAPQRCLRRSGERFNSECLSSTVKHGGGGIMVWGVFSASGVGELVRCDKPIIAKEYQKILQKGLIPSLNKLCSPSERAEVLFQQDNAPAHTARTTKSWLERRSIPAMFWPGHSPDLNPIENIWAHIKANLAGRKFGSADQLWEEVRKQWNSIDVAHCRRLSDSLPKRLACLKKSKGNAIPY